MKMSEALNMFLEYQRAKGNSDKTVIYYRGSVTRLVDFTGDIDIKDINTHIPHE
jgi:hypothetical protein